MQTAAISWNQENNRRRMFVKCVSFIPQSRKAVLKKNKVQSRQGTFLKWVKMYLIGKSTFVFQHNTYFRCHRDVSVIAPRTRCLWEVLGLVQILKIFPFLTLENNSILSPNCGFGPFLIKYLHWYYYPEATKSIFSHCCAPFRWIFIAKYVCEYAH